MASEKFPLGRVVTTPGVMAKVPPYEIGRFLARHHEGDWGLVGEEDWEENERSLRDGLRLLSVYVSSGGVRVWVISESDRSQTTVLLPEEY